MGRLLNSRVKFKLRFGVATAIPPHMAKNPKQNQHVNSLFTPKVFSLFLVSVPHFIITGTSPSADDITSCLTATFSTANSDRPYWRVGNTGEGSLEGS